MTLRQPQVPRFQVERRPERVTLAALPETRGDSFTPRRGQRPIVGAVRRRAGVGGILHVNHAAARSPQSLADSVDVRNDLARCRYFERLVRSQEGVLQIDDDVGGPRRVDASHTAEAAAECEQPMRRRWWKANPVHDRIYLSDVAQSAQSAVIPARGGSAIREQSCRFREEPYVSCAAAAPGGRFDGKHIF